MSNNLRLDAVVNAQLGIAFGWVVALRAHDRLPTGGVVWALVETCHVVSPCRARIFTQLAKTRVSLVSSRLDVFQRASS